MSKAKIDLTGQRIGNETRWIDVLYEIDPLKRKNGKNIRRYMCRCKCGKEFIARFDHLRRGAITSCGCGKYNKADTRLDISGQRYGDDQHWIDVLYEDEPLIDQHGRRVARFRCRCKCGKEFTTRLSLIRSGQVKSCGCSRLGANRIDITGKRFGNDEYWVEALYPVKDAISKNGNARARWMCRCKCGKEFIANLSDLQSGDTTSCGCGRGRASKKRKLDVIGKRYGNDEQWVEVIGEGIPYYYEPNDKYYTRCRCRCKCGNEFETMLNSLQRGHTISCGCVSSVGETRIASVLSDLGVQFEKQQKFDDCINSATNKALRFDFNLVDASLLIEYDGEQHFRAIRKDLFKYESTVHRDSIKNRWCRENNKQLIRIPYTELSRIDAAYMLKLMRLAAMEEDEELVCPEELKTADLRSAVSLLAL
jgi:very-short-patch-repair endonuclease